jgi:lipopolysaccharide export system protein LptC
MSSPTVDGLGGMQADVALRARRYAAWKSHSKRIHIYRLILPGLIGLVAAGLAGWTLYNTVTWRMGGDENKRISIRMINAKFYGRTGDDVPYLISARSAARDERDFQRVVLEQPVFVQNLNLPTETTLKAAEGVYREDTRVLSLEKNLVLVDRRGYQFKGDRAVVDTRAGIVKGDSAVAGTGPIGQIAASSYAVQDAGDRLVFRGQVKSRIVQSKDR